MKVRLLLGDKIVSTQTVSTELLAEKPTIRDVKSLALKAALEEEAIKPSEALRVTFRLFDVQGHPVDD